MSQLSEAALSAYDRHIPGAPDARQTSVHSHYAHQLLRHLLAVADLAMHAERIPTEVRQRILTTITVGQPTPADAEEIRRLTGIEAENLAQNLAALGLPPLSKPGAPT